MILALAGVLSIRASIPGPNGVIYGCYDKKGNFRIIDNAVEACKSNETQISWGPSQAYITTSLGSPTPGVEVGQSAFIASLPLLPPGAYVIDASTNLYNEDTTYSAGYSCTLHLNAYLGNNETLGAVSAVNMEPQAAIPNQQANVGSISIHDAQLFSVPTQISLHCDANTAGSNTVNAQNTVLRATLVGGVATEPYHTFPYPNCAFDCQ